MAAGTGRCAEDALQVVCAQAGGAEAIVTRDTADYRRAPLPAVSPKQLVAALGV